MFFVALRQGARRPDTQRDASAQHPTSLLLHSNPCIRMSYIAVYKGSKLGATRTPSVSTAQNTFICESRNY